MAPQNSLKNIDTEIFKCYCESEINYTPFPENVDMPPGFCYMYHYPWLEWKRKENGDVEISRMVVMQMFFVPRFPVKYLKGKIINLTFTITVVTTMQTEKDTDVTTERLIEIHEHFRDRCKILLENVEETKNGIERNPNQIWPNMKYFYVEHHNIISDAFGFYLDPKRKSKSKYDFTQHVFTEWVVDKKYIEQSSDTTLFKGFPFLIDRIKKSILTFDKMIEKDRKDISSGKVEIKKTIYDMLKEKGCDNEETTIEVIWNAIFKLGCFRPFKREPYWL